MKIDWSVFSYPFDDKHWQSKFATGAGLMLVSIFFFPLFWLALPVAGYGLRIMRKSAQGEAPALPEWDNWGELFTDGLRVAIVAVVYLLPVLALVFCLYAVWMGFGFSAPMLASGTSREVERSLLPMIFGLYGLSFVLFGVTFLLAIPLGFLSAAAVSRLAATNSVSKAFEFNEVWSLVKRGFKNYAVAYAAYIAVAFAAGLMAQIPYYTVVLCCLTPFTQAIAAFYLQTQMGVLFGMAHYETEHPSTPTASTGTGVFKDTEPLIKTDPLLKKAEAVKSAGAHDEFGTEEVPAVNPADVKTTAAQAEVDEFATDEVPAVDPADVKPKAGASAPKKPRAPRKKKSGGEEDPA